MANCHTLFLDFDQNILLNNSRKKSLKRSRKSIRDRIRKYFKDYKSNEKVPKFWSQGSFEMNISVNPIERKAMIDGEERSQYKYDVDDGVYFIDKEENRKSINTYHTWIYDAVDGHTGTSPVDKNTCIRVIFSDGHNIDLPIYFLVKGDDEIPQLAHKKHSWIDSDPRELINWFNQIANQNPQLRSLVRYLKAWCDYQNYEYGL